MDDATVLSLKKRNLNTSKLKVTFTEKRYINTLIFVVFSSMGFYPVTPGIPAYTIGSPVFSKVTIALSNGKKFTMKANNCSITNKYIQSAKMNGVKLDSPWFTHKQLINGGTLELEMGPLPNKQWGAGQSF